MTAPPSTRSSSGRRWRLVRARPDAVPPSVRRFSQRARRRRLRAARPWAAGLAVALLAGLIAWIGYGTSLVGVREVRVTGVSVLTVPEVRQAAGIRRGTPLARVDLAAVRRRVTALAPVDHVTVTRDWPHTVVVRVTERTAVAVVPQGRKFLLVDRAGVVYHTVASRPSGLPTVAARSAGDIKAGVQVLVALTPRLRDELVSVTVDGPARIQLKLVGGRKVVWGDATRSELKAKVATALLSREGETFDVSAPDVVTIR
ncbi:MAG: FtsQ-type POTRA domain-containing protein [Micromonosporaceae bacterium]|nr:FtsQ-type POTRA domain-containing protein [Micromonosporaceae bacterium]